MEFAPAVYIKKEKEKGNVSYIVLPNSEALWRSVGRNHTNFKKVIYKHGPQIYNLNIGLLMF